VQLGNVDRGQAAWFLAGSLEGVMTPANWKVGPDAPGSSTPGGANSEENAAWVNYLRTPPEK
jgi:transcription elongation factor